MLLIQNLARTQTDVDLTLYVMMYFLVLAYNMLYHENQVVQPNVYHISLVKPIALH